MKNILMIDNYDSFTYNLVHYFSGLHAEVQVFKNDELSLADISRLNPDGIVISPGPGNPDQAGISLSLIHEYYRSTPILGVCLGHQCIAQAFGGTIIHAKKIMHGKTSAVFHNGSGIFKSLKNPFTATRYHSLVADITRFPAELQITAWTQTANGELDEIMGLQHKKFPIFGVQFHPEAILTECGKQILGNFLSQSER